MYLDNPMKRSRDVSFQIVDKNEMCLGILQSSSIRDVTKRCNRVNGWVHRLMFNSPTQRCLLRLHSSDTDGPLFKQTTVCNPIPLCFRLPLVSCLVNRGNLHSELERRDSFSAVFMGLHILILHDFNGERFEHNLPRSRHWKHRVSSM